ncbi:Mmm1p [Malassezia vespertilionis]|uniref:Mmm1p n=1 Tax=Malassezia vespertilionis TaxID=2020962 RepID=A0A2N1JF88_9BASI|nr:Mmm1p [Malassezia vespertilionis]
MAYGLGHSPAPRELTFTQGFVAGQLVLILLLAFLFRYFFMTNVPASLEKQRADLIARTETMQKSLDARCKAQKQGRAVPYDQSLEARILDMLQRTHYDMSAHPPESVDWLTLLAAQIIYGYRESILQAAQHIHDPNQGMPLPSLQTPEKAATKRVLERALNGAVGGHTMGLLDTITVTDINFGSQYPTFSNARFRPSDKPNGLRLEVDFDYVDTISIGLDTKLLLNFPRLRFGSLALALTLRIERFAGTAAVEVGPRGA